MITLQTYFLQFHDNIKLGNYEDEENGILRDKRAILLNELSKLTGKEIPETQITIYYDRFDQGSYAMRTGIKPLDGDYDIDEGIKFYLTRQEIDPYELKKIVYNILNTKNRTVIIRGPCLTVKYTAYQ